MPPAPGTVPSTLALNCWGVPPPAFFFIALAPNIGGFGGGGGACGGGGGEGDEPNINASIHRNDNENLCQASSDNGHNAYT